ncbi:MAG: hypothetical protein AAF849_14885 [Bacteroidota bacterium]
MKRYFLFVLIGLLYLSCEKDVAKRQLLRGIVINACDSSVFENVQLQLFRSILSGRTISPNTSLLVKTVVSDANGYFELEYPLVASNLYWLEISAPETKYGYIGDDKRFSFDASPLIEKTIIIREQASVDFEFSNMNYDSLHISLAYNSSSQLEDRFTLFQGQDSTRIDTLACGLLNIQAIGIIGERIDSFHSEQIHIIPAEDIDYQLQM